MIQNGIFFLYKYNHKMLHRSNSLYYGRKAPVGIITDSLSINYDPSMPESYRHKGNVAYDTSGNLRDGVCNSSQIYNSFYPGVYYPAAVYNIQVPFDANGMTDISFDMWLKYYSLNDYDSPFILWSGGGVKLCTIEYRESSGQFLVIVTRGGWPETEVSYAPIDSSNYTHIVITFSVTWCRLYSNGALLWQSSSVSGAFSSTGGTIVVGSGDGSFKGWIGSFRMYSKELSASEVLSNFEYSRQRFGV